MNVGAFPSPWSRAVAGPGGGQVEQVVAPGASGLPPSGGVALEDRFRTDDQPGANRLG